MDNDDRTTPLGLFNYARSYWQSGEHLNAAKLQVTHKEAPTTFLFYHSIELYLKAFLRSKSIAIKELRKIGHNVSELLAAAISHGLELDDEDRAVIAAMSEFDTVIRSRYIVTGFFNRPAEEALSRVCKSLDISISSALKTAGETVRDLILLPSEYPVSPSANVGLPVSNMAAPELAGLVNGLVEAGLAWTFKIPLSVDDQRLKNYELLEKSTHPIWTDREINQLRREFLHWWAIVGARDEHGNTANETMEARAELRNYGRQLIDRLNGKSVDISIQLNASPSRIDDYAPVSAITVTATSDQNNCLVQMEEFSGRWPDGMPNPLVLRTEGQIRGARSGRFKLSNGQPKTVPIIFRNKIRSNEWYFFDENKKIYLVPAGPAKFLLRVYGGKAPTTALLFIDTDAGWNPIPSLRIVADGYSLNFR